MSIKGGAEVVRLSGGPNPHFVQRRSRIEPDGIAVARTGNGNGDGEAKEIVRRFERALARGKSLDRATDEDTKKPKLRSDDCLDDYGNPGYCTDGPFKCSVL